MNASEFVFSYGTLRRPEVQRVVFGGDVVGRPDAIVGYRVDEIRITDPEVVRTSGSDVHPILVPGEDGEEVDGTVLELTPEQLACADEYEVDTHTRVRVPLRSRRDAWVYVLADLSG